MCLYGYCRISRKTMNIERQVRNILAAYPTAHIVKEAFTGTKIQGRKELDKLLKVLKPGDTVVFDTVVGIKNRVLRVGEPYVKGATVTAKVEKQGKGKKIHIFKYVAKSSSTRRKQGHRQPYTKLIIESIEG